MKLQGRRSGRAASRHPAGSILSRDVHMLGDLLGEALLAQEGRRVFVVEESLREATKRMRRRPSAANDRRARTLVRRMNLDVATKVLRAFTAYFHLINAAEQKEIVRVNREREFGAGERPRPESIGEAIYLARRSGLPAKDLQALLERLRIQPVFTAHPTEARRRSVLQKLKRISTLLVDLDVRQLLPREREHLVSEIRRHVTTLWQTDEVRASPLTALDEVQNGLFFFDETIASLTPLLYQDLERSLARYFPGTKFRVAPFLRYGSWVGGDRDGNPNVTPEITRRAVRAHRGLALHHHIGAIRALRRELSPSVRLIKISPELQASIREDSRLFSPDEETSRRYAVEPYRLKLWFIEKRLRNTLQSAESGAIPDSTTAYAESGSFLQDLRLIQSSLRRNKGQIIGDHGFLPQLIAQVDTFGFHMAELDVRQHSEEHEAALTHIFEVLGTLDRPYRDLSEAEKIRLLTENLLSPRPLVGSAMELPARTRDLLEVFRIIRESHQLFGTEAIRCYVVSFTHATSDVLEPLLLAKEAGLFRWVTRGTNRMAESDLDIVPLFETVEDLRGAGSLLADLFQNPAYQHQLRGRGRFHEVMLGYSDSNKDAGYLSANWELYKAQDSIVKACAESGVEWRLFHGRGGSIGRGGGRAGQAILAQPRGSVAGRFRFTEQGEVIAFRYSLLPLAHRHMEQIVHAVLISSMPRGKQKDLRLLPAWRSLMEQMAETSRREYRALIYDDPKFWEFYIQATPIRYISRLPIASRPAHRKGLEKLEDLRAIPWVFSWTQTRMMVPSWYGVGTALEEAARRQRELEALREMYARWPFFRSVIENCQMALAKADMLTARHYAELVRPPSLRRRVFGRIVAEYARTRRMLLAITQQVELLDNTPVIQRSIRLRNPYTDPLNLIQAELLRRARAPAESGDAEEQERLNSAILISINGIAAAMQETG